MSIRRFMILALLATTTLVGANVVAHAAIMFFGPCNSLCVPTESDVLTANRIIWTLIGDLSK